MTVHVGAPVPVERVQLGTPLRLPLTSGGPALPIDTTGTTVGAVLVAGADGVYRPAPAPPAQQRGSVVHYLADVPTGIPQGAMAGDWVTVIAGEHAGAIYLVEDS